MCFFFSFLFSLYTCSSVILIKKRKLFAISEWFVNVNGKLVTEKTQEFLSVLRTVSDFFFF